MVFSLFKKPKPSDDEPKTVPRPRAAVPPPVSPRPASAEAERLGTPSVPPLDFATGSQGVQSRGAATAPALDASTEFPDDDLGALDFAGLEVSDVGIQLEHEASPLQGLLEQVVMLYANGADTQVAAILAEVREQHRQGVLAERLWLMQLDLCQVLNQRAEFDQLALAFANAFEKSPPTWQIQPDACPAPAAPRGALQFKGALEAGNDEGFAALSRTLEQGRPGASLAWDFAKVTLIDPEGCARLAACFDQARQRRIGIALSGIDGLMSRLLPRCEAGKPEAEGCWLLLLNLLALSGDGAGFEEKAVDYAVTFEVSPPAWEPVKAVATAVPERAAPAGDDAFCLSGQLAGERFAGLADFAALRNPVTIDLSRVARMDFSSAGALLNALTPLKTAGKTVVIRGANQLVAELLTLVGVSAVAQVLSPKR